MPLLKFDIIRGRSNEEIRKLLDATHEAMVEAFEVPITDRYQAVTQHEPEDSFWKTPDLVIAARQT